MPSRVSISCLENVHRCYMSYHLHTLTLHILPIFFVQSIFIPVRADCHSYVMSLP
ncbi:hypothetical protein KFK09_008810 [Dendrobium nobile]|uniref:Uncharacterized protein n=1 Tax=Dendrobium nobile TaxID=94219 RepID=A0A8T3BNZ5_DENNO|nr:hypothetical protein KFK09_008810 [Dendrobium nobile]